MILVEREFESEILDGVEDSGTKPSRLSRLSIDFGMDADSEAYSEEWAQNNDRDLPDDFLLEGHSVMVEHLGLLPKELVAIGDSWEVDANVYFKLSTPGFGPIYSSQRPRRKSSFGQKVYSHTLKAVRPDRLHLVIKRRWQGIIGLKGRVSSVTENTEVDSEEAGDRYALLKTTS